MKKHILQTLFIALAGIFSLVSCCDDESYPIEQEMTGRFIGSFEGTVRIDSILRVPVGEGTELMPEGSIYRKETDRSTSNGLALTLTQADDKHVNMQFHDFYYQGQSWDFEVTNVEVGRLYDTYTLNGSAAIRLESLGDCEVSVIGSANAAALACTVYITCPRYSATADNVGKGGIGEIELSFICTKATGDEDNQARIETFELPTSAGANKNAELEGGTLDQANHTIHFTCKADADLSKLKPTITVSPEETAKVYPASESEVDFSSGQYIFSVVAEDGTKVNYTVTITPREEEIAEE